MYRVATFLFLLTFAGSIRSQIYSFDYSGAPGNVRTDSISGFLGDRYLIEFCTESVPDKLTIYTAADSIAFEVGNNIATDTAAHRYHGYAELVLNGELSVSVTDSASIPEGVVCDSRIGGIMRLYLTSDACQLKFKVEGNKLRSTVYTISIFRLNSRPIVSDTISIPECGHLHPYLLMNDCKAEWIIPIDSSIRTDVEVRNESCIGSSDGAIEFASYPQFNRYDLPAGQYKIKISNSVCIDTFNVDVDTGKLCKWYIPNAFSPNGDGTNDVFMMFAPASVPYQLSIFDRWGDLIFQRECVANQSGWDGMSADYRYCITGVYVWKIECLGDTFFGDLTLIR